jgi:hypothetical protein
MSIIKKILLITKEAQNNETLLLQHVWAATAVHHIPAGQSVSV